MMVSLSAEHLELRLIQSKQDIENPPTINLYVCIYILFIYLPLYFYLLPISLNITSTVLIIYIPVMDGHTYLTKPAIINYVSVNYTELYCR